MIVPNIQCEHVSYTIYTYCLRKLFQECIEVLNTFVELVIVVGETFVYAIIQRPHHDFLENKEDHQTIPGFFCAWVVG